MPRFPDRIPALALAALTLAGCGASERESANVFPEPVRPTEVTTTEAPATPTVSSVDQDQALCHKLNEASNTGNAHTAASIFANAEEILAGLKNPDLRRVMQEVADVAEATRAGNGDIEAASQVGLDLALACSSITGF